VIEALGHCALMLLYAATLILRNENADDWDGETMKEEACETVSDSNLALVGCDSYVAARSSFADGWFIVFMFGIVLPSPSFYYFYTENAGQTPDKTKLETEFHSETVNPLSIDSAESQGGSKQQAPAARTKVIKAQREAKEMRTENQKLQKEIAALRKIKRDSRADEEMPADAETEALAKTQIDMMKGFVADENLSEEARESAKKALALLVTSQIAETSRNVEQAATLGSLHSQAQFNDDFVQFSGQFISSKYQNAMPKDRCSDEMAEWLHSHRLLHHAAKIIGVAGTCV
jgi:hypothetical protein